MNSEEFLRLYESGRDFSSSVFIGLNKGRECLLIDDGDALV